MTNLQGQIGSMMGGMSITGNAMVDTMILTSIVPILMTYSASVFSIVRTIGTALFAMVTKWFKNYSRGRIIGNQLLSIKIDKDNELYAQLYDVFKKDSNVSRMRNYMMNMSSYFESVEGKTQSANTYNMSLNYDSDKLFDIPRKYGVLANNIKVFEYKKYYIKFTLNIATTGGDTPTTEYPISIEVLSYSETSLTCDDAKIVKILEEFMEDKLSINKKIPFVYTIKVEDRPLASHFYKMARRNTSGTGKLLNIGNNKLPFDKHDDAIVYADKSALLTMKNSNFTKKQDHTEDIIFQSSGCDANINLDNLSSVKSIHRTYISKTPDVSAKDRSYFINDNKIYLLYIYTATATIYIISFGKKLTNDNMKQEMNYLMGLAYDADEEANNNKKDNDKTNEKTVRKPTYIHKRQGTRWTGFNMDIRSFDTIFLPDKQMASIRKEFDNFFELEQLYQVYQIPYKKGLLFYGPPGTGKTSLVKALAYEYGMDIYLLNVNDSDVNDDTISDILNEMSSCKKKKILLFEDIDSAFSDKGRVHDKIQDKSVPVYTLPPLSAGALGEGSSGSASSGGTSGASSPLSAQGISSGIGHVPPIAGRKPQKCLTYSGLLNALDGVLSNQNGVITIMTTNFIEKLGEAFLRPGRIDKKFKLTECNYEQICKMIATFIEKRQKISLKTKKIEIDWKAMDKRIDEFARSLCDEDDMSTVKPCALQFYILKYIEDIDSIFTNKDELLSE